MTRMTHFAILVFLGVGMLPMMGLAQTGGKLPTNQEELEKAVAKVLEKSFKKAINESFDKQLKPQLQQIVTEYTKREIAPLSKSIDKLKGQISKLQANQGTSTLRLEKLKEEIDALRKDLKTTMVDLTAFIAAMKERNSGSSGEGTKNNDKVARKNQPPLDVDALIAKMKKVLRPMLKKEMEEAFGGMLKAEIGALRKDCQYMFQQVEAMKKVNGELRGELGSVQKNNDTLQTQIAALQKKIDTLEQQRESFYPPLEMENLKKQVAQLTEDLRKMEEAALKKTTAKSSPGPLATSTLIITNDYNEDLVFLIKQSGYPDRVERVQPGAQLTLRGRPPGVVTCTVLRDNVGEVGTTSVRLNPNKRSQITASFPR